MRAAMALFTLLTVSLIVFTLMELVPGDCAERYLAFKNTQGSAISVADIEAERVRLGLDRPFIERWAGWIGNVFIHGEFGTSCILRLDINQLLGDKFLISLGICLTALMLAYLIAVPVGMIAASVKSPALNSSLRFVSYLGLALPNFLLALIIMLVLDGLVRRQPDGAVLARVPRRALVLGQGPRLPQPRLAAGLHPRLVGDRLRAADRAGADVGRDRQALRHRRRARAASRARG